MPVQKEVKERDWNHCKDAQENGTRIQVLLVF